jgi:hypothetical protein
MLTVQKSSGARVERLRDGGVRLQIPAGPAGSYRLAQLDDYKMLPRRALLWQPPVRLQVRARASATDIPGTWGFGLWNNPLGIGLFKGADRLRLPALPQAAWFFIAAPENYLSLHDELPGSGFLAATFSSRRPSVAQALGGAALLPFMMFRGAAGHLRQKAKQFVRQDSRQLRVDCTGWHSYQITWTAELVRFSVDGEQELETQIIPGGPLGLVLWVDNQYAAWTPTGQLSYGTLANPQPAWLELDELRVNGDEVELADLDRIGSA